MMQGCMRCVASSLRNAKIFIKLWFLVVRCKDATQRNAMIGSESILAFRWVVASGNTSTTQCNMGLCIILWTGLNTCASRSHIVPTSLDIANVFICDSLAVGFGGCTTRVVSALVSVESPSGSSMYTVPAAGQYIHKHCGFWNFNPGREPGFRYSRGNTITVLGVVTWDYINTC